VLVWRAEQIAQAIANLYEEIVVDDLTLPEIIKHNEEILRLAREGVDISALKMYMVYYGLTMQQLHEVGVTATDNRTPARSCEGVHCSV